MTATPSVLFGQFGQTLAFAERALTATLRQHLAKRETKPETWYALQLIATRGPGLAREEPSSDLEGSRTLDADSTRELLARLEAEGMIRGDATLELTAEGEALHRSLREYIAGPTVRLLGQFDAPTSRRPYAHCRRSPRARRTSSRSPADARLGVR